MESNPLFDALQNLYGDGTPPPPDTSTVRGLLSYCKLWLSGEITASDLHNPCLQMASRLKGGAQETESDLRSNPTLIDEVRMHVQRTAEAYLTLSEILDRLPLLAQENDTERYQEALKVFEEERQAVLDSSQAIASRLSGEHRLCPRCGAVQESFCEKCQLTTLFPDPRGNEYDRTKTADLEPRYAAVYQAYVGVMGGERPLGVLHRPLNELEDALVEAQKGYEDVLNSLGDDVSSPEVRESVDAANLILDEIEKMFEGIDRIRGVFENFQMSDLTRGWDTIFDSAVDVQRVTQRFLKVNAELLEQDEDE